MLRSAHRQTRSHSSADVAPSDPDAVVQVNDDQVCALSRANMFQIGLGLLASLAEARVLSQLHNSK